ncbi:DUF6415 family natural product biosynthesis protein [Streptomyces sp. GS7]|uniref:DUF6415 family natural product biosynthesis protein n=1 Tax=Streptomyces sp. GS7 TaxID=2692234 RepID=UPI001319047F|nr:DUF6415 family natural product biosynthesis protein [Streptomyces sp. GS7]QHC26374.1 hypothetical protein GR130_38425 [Streptomyces sp. GS7]
MTLVERALAWDPENLTTPDLDTVLDMIEHFSQYGRVVANELRVLCRSLPVGSAVAVRARATLGEADRRLNLPRSIANRQARHRAQNLARLLKALHRATGLVYEEWPHTAGQVPRHTSTAEVDHSETDRPP